MRSPLIALALLWMSLGCSNHKAAHDDPRGFVKANINMLDSCTNYILNHIDTLLTCDVVDSSSTASIYEASSIYQCDFITNDSFLQRILKTEIEFIQLTSDSTINYILEGSDEKKCRYSIFYKKSRSAKDLYEYFPPYNSRLPEVVVENYYVVTTNFPQER